MALFRPAFPRLQRGHTFARGLVSAWEFTEGAGRTAYDSSGYGNHGVLTGGPFWVGGPEGSALSFFYDGSGHTVTAPTPTQFNSATQATICGWMYRAVTNGNVMVGSSSGDSLYRYQVNWYYDGVLYCSLSNGSGEYSWVNLPGIGWHHICLVFNGALSGNTKVALYINGVPKVLSYNTTPPTTLPTIALMGNFIIGNSAVSGAGIVYSVRAYSRALSAEEISGMYATDSQGLFRSSSAQFLSVLTGAQPLPPSLHVVSTPMRW